MSFLVVPQWQGSPSSRAMRLAEGALVIRGDLPSSATRLVAVPLEAGDDQGSGISRFSSLQLIRERLDDALGEATGTPIVIGGDCSVSDAAIRRHAATAPALVWFDAHPDLNSPDSSPSRAYSGMILRALIDDGVIAADRVVLIGARTFDDAEDAYAAESGIRLIGVDEADPETVAAAVSATGASSIYVHIDLDVLDPSAVAGLLDPQPFGLSAEALLAALGAVRGAAELAGATVASFAPESERAAVDDLPTVLRVIGALSKNG